MRENVCHEAVISLANDDGVEAILDIPGVYELVADYYADASEELVEQWEEERRYWERERRRSL